MAPRIQRLPTDSAEQLLLVAQALYLESCRPGTGSTHLIVRLSTPNADGLPIDRLLTTLRREVERRRLPTEPALLSGSMVVVLARHLVAASTAPPTSELGHAFCCICRRLHLHCARVWHRIAQLAHHLAVREQFNAIPTLQQLRHAVHARRHQCEEEEHHEP